MSRTTPLPVISNDVRTHDNSMMSTYNLCHRKYNLRYRRHLVPKRVRAALNFGGLMHQGLDTWYSTFDPKAALHTIDDAEWQEPEGDDYRTQGRALTVLAKYIEHYRKDPSWDVVLTESPFEVVDDDGFRWGGKVDLVVRGKGGAYGNYYWVVDHKTTSRFGSRYWDPFYLSRQMAGYVWAARQLTGEDIQGVIMNVLAVRKRQYPPDEMFHRRPILYPVEMLEEWRDSQIDAYAEILRLQEMDRWRPNWDGCVTKYGRCTFYDYCRADADTREHILNHDFKVKKWDWMEED